MLFKPDCIPCVLKMSLGLLRKLPLDENAFHRVFKQILKLPELRGDVSETTSPQVIETIMRYMQAAVGDSDPFRDVKQAQNDQMAAIYAELKKQVQDADDPFETAVKFAIIGNAIDFMMAGGPADMLSFLRQKQQETLPEKNILKFKNRVLASRTIVYFTDNCGEVFLDMLLAETIKALHPKLELFFVVKSMPALNDVTIKEAKAVGLDRIGTVIGNGIDGPLPGTMLARCSRQVRALVEEADLVISKGGGNFDTLGEEIDEWTTDISFLLLSKCVPYTDFFKVEMYIPVLFNVFH